MSWSPLELHKHGVELVCQDDGSLSRTLAPIGAALRAAYAEADRISKNADPDCVDWLVDDYCELTESLLGAVYVVCQARITQVVSAVRHLAVYCDANHLAPNLVRAKPNLLTLGVQHAGTAITQIQGLDALANYFKHRDEWTNPTDWSQLKGKSHDTATVVKQLGLTELTTGNLRKGSEALGNPQYDKVDVFAVIVEDWAKVVATMAKNAVP